MISDASLEDNLNQSFKLYDNDRKYKIKLSEIIVKKIRQTLDDRKISDRYGCLPKEEIILKWAKTRK